MLIWQLVSIQMITFILFILALRWLYYSHISFALKRLQKLNRENLEKEEAAKKELERGKRGAQREIEQGRQEAEAIIKRAKEEAESGRENVLAKARKEARRLINEAIRDCQRKEKELTMEMEGKAVYLATDMVKYLFTEKNCEILHTELIDELISEIEKINRDTLKADGDNAEVICVYKLKENQKKKIKEALSSKLNKNITLTERISEDIVAGLIIRLGGFVIDGSMKNRFKRILPLLKEKARKLEEVPGDISGYREQGTGD